MPTVEQLLPVAAEAADGDATPLDYIYEPDAATLLDRLLRQYITTLIHRAFLEVDRQRARRAHDRDGERDARTRREMIDRLTLEMNRARQAAITKELMEIVGGAEALKG